MDSTFSLLTVESGFIVSLYKNRKWIRSDCMSDSYGSLFHYLFYLIGYSAKASFWLCEDCTCSGERMGLVCHLSNHVRVTYFSGKLLC